MGKFLIKGGNCFGEGGEAGFCQARKGNTEERLANLSTKKAGFWKRGGGGEGLGGRTGAGQRGGLPNAGVNLGESKGKKGGAVKLKK